MVISLAIEKETSILSSIVDQVSSQEYMDLHNVSCVSDVESANGMMTFCPFPPVYMNLLLLCMMIGHWLLQMHFLLAGSDCACPDATIAESANC